MPFFAIQYRVLFHDTMAYGSHHYMTNFKFQNMARETVLFESTVNGTNGWAAQLQDVVMLTREAYCTSLSPVKVGEKVAILMTYEEPSRSTVRLCFRIVQQCGQPVSCGYQTMLVMDKDSHELVPAPTVLTQYLDASSPHSLLEKLTNPSFADRARSSRGVKDIFSPEICALGKTVANTPLQKAYPKIVDEALNEYSLGG